jgi:hypothetical protein
MGSEWMLGRLAGGVWSGYSWLRIQTGSGHDPSGSGAMELVSY